MNEREWAEDRATTTHSIDNMYFTEEDDAEGRERSRDGQRKHDARTTDYHGRGQKEWRSARTPREMQRQRRPLDCHKNCSGHQIIGRSRVVLK